VKKDRSGGLRNEKKRKKRRLKEFMRHTEEKFQLIGSRVTLD
jgi:hypothetical protein